MVTAFLCVADVNATDREKKNRKIWKIGNLRISKLIKSFKSRKLEKSQSSKAKIGITER